MAYPSLALAVSTLALMTAFFIAGFTSDKLFVKIMTAGAYFTLIFLAVLAIYVFSAQLENDVSDSNNDPLRATECHDPPSPEPKVVRDSGVFHSIDDHR
ncbi:hypothetical protein CY34DRAFT_812037 [Suillus luteus UH-Slu-Lm8-n1]|uniref:Uncharacterized protein n=1 Tax=Suillus luteus UH-Slu-Lm8-n1 TaxID=930992 RepID=A0A0D0A1D5_9AGAM|nr:hypothetical protein CY34DRAFT_812037 [Suillus luteus UH-Slu-Lm8-n1]